jgi:hypothetical protein
MLDTFYTASGREFPPTMQDLFTNLRGCRDDIHHEFDKAKSSEERGLLLNVYHASMKIAQSWVAPQDLETFKTACAQDYALFLVKETRLPDGNIDFPLLERVTWREVEAGRMSPDHNLRKTALEACHALREAALPTELSPLERRNAKLIVLGIGAALFAILLVTLIVVKAAGY